MTNIGDRVYQYIAAHGGKIVPSECARELGVSSEAIRDTIRLLLDNGKLKRSEKKSEEEIQRLVSEKRSIQDEMDKLPARVAGGDLALGEYEVRRAALQERLQNVVKELTSLPSPTVRPFPTEAAIGVKPEAVSDLIKERDRIVTWIRNLGAKKDDFSNETYTKVMGDYQTRLATIRTSLAGSLEGLRKLLVSNKLQKEQLSTELEDLEARHIAGEQGEENYKAQKVDLERGIKQASDIIIVVEELLKQIEQTD